MSWLFQAWQDKSLFWLGVSTLLALLSGACSGWIAYRLKRRELIAAAVAAVEQRRGTLQVESEEARRERVRQEVLRWANPILGAVDDLISRMRNILESAGWRALDPTYQPQSNPNWSITHEYFFISTLYLFAQYFACVRLLQEQLSFELFCDESTKDEFFMAVEAVASRLGRYPPMHPAPGTVGTGVDAQVFRLQQRCIGEAVILRGESNRRMSYHEFLERWGSDAPFRAPFEPLSGLLLNLDDGVADARHVRLTAALQALVDLQARCRRLLRM